jgi:hypothetical protein
MNIRAAAVIAIPTVALGTWLLWPSSSPSNAAAAAAGPQKGAAQAPAQPEIPATQVDLALALEQSAITAEFAGNGKDRLRAMLVNKSANPLEVTFPLGQVFESENGASVVVVLAESLVVPPGKTKDIELRTAALRSARPSTIFPTPPIQSWSRSFARCSSIRKSIATPSRPPSSR